MRKAPPFPCSFRHSAIRFPLRYRPSDVEVRKNQQRLSSAPPLHASKPLRPFCQRLKLVSATPSYPPSFLDVYFDVKLPISATKITSIQTCGEKTLSNSCNTYRLCTLASPYGLLVRSGNAHLRRHHAAVLSRRLSQSKIKPSV